MEGALSGGREDLASLFDPVSVAVVGASDDSSKWGNWLARAAMAGPHPCYLVNHGRDEVLGTRSYRSLLEVPGPVGLVAVCVPAAAYPAAVEDALHVRAPVIVGISAGMGETGPAGRLLEQQLALRVRAAGSALLGPNCLGVSDSGSGLRLTSNPLPAGRIALLSQSGNLSLDLAGQLQAHGLGLSRFASLGNQSDIDLPRLVEVCGRHEATDVIAVYCEEFTDGRRFVEAARNAGKPVVLLTVGASAGAARTASSHTGSIVSGSSVVDAACAAAGVHRVDSPGAMADLLTVLSGPIRPSGPRLGIVTDGGGHAAVAADLAEQAGLTVPAFSPGLRGRVAAHLPRGASTSNPVDVAGGGERDITCFSSVAREVLASGEVDALLLSGYFGGYAAYGDQLAALELEEAGVLGRLVAEIGFPLAVHTLFPDGAPALRLRAEGIPVFRRAEAVTRSWGLLTSALARPPQPIGTGGEAAGLPPSPVASSPPVVDTAYWDARSLLDAAGVPFPGGVLVRKEAGLLAATGLRYPLVLKACGLLHKSDIGGVVLGLEDADQLRAAYGDMVERIAPPACAVEEMADLSAGVELLVGVCRDPRFGPVVLVGMGGVYAEVLSDVQLALAPVSAAEAVTLLLRLRGSPLLRGARGRPHLDLQAAGRVVANISVLAAAHPEIGEVEVNPLLLLPVGALALDARVVLA